MISTSQSLLCGIPQVSVLFLLLVLYSADVIKDAAGHVVSIHALHSHNADDMQTYTSCAVPDQQTATDRILAHVADIDSWMSSNRLKLNAEKTEFIWLGTCQQMAKVSTAGQRSTHNAVGQSS